MGHCYGTVVWTVICATHTMAFECDRNSEHCFTSLEINYAHTMYSQTLGPVIPKHRNLYDKNGIKQLNWTEPITSADGFHIPRKLIVANGTMPGPSIVIYENQTITIFLKNKLFNEAVTIHWHGIDQLTSQIA